MAKGLYRSRENPQYVLVDYDGALSMATSEADYRQRGYAPDFDDLPWEDEYKAGRRGRPD